MQDWQRRDATDQKDSASVGGAMAIQCTDAVDQKQRLDRNQKCKHAAQNGNEAWDRKEMKNRIFPDKR